MHSTVSRGYIVTSGSAIVNPESAVGAAISSNAAYHSGVEDISSASGSETASGSNSRKSSDETAIVVSGRKNSMTKAVRYDPFLLRAIAYIFNHITRFMLKELLSYYSSYFRRNSAEHKRNEASMW